MTNGAESEGRAPAGFRRELGLWDTTVVVAGAILGVGIFVNPSNVARILPDPGWMLAAWLAGGVVALLGSFVYAELGARLPEVGGQYVYLARSWSPFVGYLYGVTLLFVINSGGMAAVASVLASYVDGSILHLGGVGRPALAAAVLVVLAEVNVRGVRPGKRVNNGLMALKLGGIATLFALALVRRPEAATSVRRAHRRRCDARDLLRRPGSDPLRLRRLAELRQRRGRDPRSAPHPGAGQRARRGPHRRRLRRARRARPVGAARRARSPARTRSPPTSPGG